MTVDDRLLLDLALAEVRRLRDREAKVPVGAQLELPNADALVAEAAQAAVQLRCAASRLALRAPREAASLRERADRLTKLLPRRAS